ncbi:hypothetical protein O181_130802 [Austropuccinia psidii MF-1]|uniref:Uncharacterized protein n=1 Tax=Austropuccinia psidii MF-1 TaxID=1389203 RepID=A0A9Q3L1V2_9BASI|nr:hypothetical protein [Austropuccinia psidii MF-1]
MAFLGHLGPYGPWSAGHLGPFWPNPMRPKGAKGGSHLAPKARWVPIHIWAHLSQNWPFFPWSQNWPKTFWTILATNPIGPIFGLGPPWTNISAMASGNHQRPPDQLSQPSPQLMGNPFHPFIPSVLKVAGMVHIWYYIPLCTIFAQQSNGDVFRIQLKVSNPNAHFEGGLISSSV